MAYSAAQLQSLQDALASGELEVQFEGKVVKYRSIAELKTAIAVVNQALVADGTISAPTQSTTFAAFCRD